MESTLVNIFVFLTAACLVVPIAGRFKLGSVPGYVMAGVIIGPFGLAYINDAEKVEHFTDFGRVMMLFLIGLELEPALLRRTRKSILGLCGFQVLLCTFAFTLSGLALGYAWQLSLAAGMALSLSSTALVMQMLQESKLMNTPLGNTAFSVLLFQDIAVIPILVIMPLLAVNGDERQIQTSLISGLPGWSQAIIIAGVIASVVATGRYLSYYLFWAVARTRLRELFTALSLAVIVGISLLMHQIGISPALGTFVAGLVLANSEYRQTLQTDIEPFKGLLLSLFFISVGLSMDFRVLAASPLNLLLAVASLIIVKAAIWFVLGRAFGLHKLHNAGFSLVLAQGGEFALVLFQYAGHLSIFPPALEKFLTLAVTLSIALTPMLMTLYHRLIVPNLLSGIPAPAFDHVAEDNPVILAGFGRFGQVIGRFLIAQNISTSVLEKDPEQIELLRKFGFKGYFGDASRVGLLRKAGAAKAKLLIVAVDDPQTSLEIVARAKAEFPHLDIFARARNRRHAYELSRAGVKYFIRETFNSSLEMAQQIMIALGKNETEMQVKAIIFKQHDEAALIASFDFYDDEPELVNFSRTQRADLERILQNDIGVDAAKSS